jgi:hypothetical protein
LTVKELRKKLAGYPDDIPVRISIPTIILDDGYVEEYKRCKVYDTSTSNNGMEVMIDYDPNDYESEE